MHTEPPIARFANGERSPAAQLRPTLRGESLWLKFGTSDLLYWQAVVAVIVAQLGLCYGAMTCRGYPPMTENEIFQVLSSPLIVWLPAIFGSRVNRLRGIMLMSLTTTVLLVMVYVNGDIRSGVWITFWTIRNSQSLLCPNAVFDGFLHTDCVLRTLLFRARDG